MIDLRVEYLGLVRNVTGVKAESLQVEASNVRQLLDLLVERHGPGLRDLLFTGRGELRANASVLLGEEDIRDTGGLDMKLADEQRALVLLVVNPLEGG